MTTSTRPLKANHVTVETAVVQIRTLTVGRKQMTLAMFRQLPEEGIITTDGQFRGLPWGTVNYHAKDCGLLGVHLHVIWQRGEELRRAEVLQPAAAPSSELLGAQPGVRAWAHAHLLTATEENLRTLRGQHATPHRRAVAGHLDGAEFQMHLDKDANEYVTFRLAQFGKAQEKWAAEAAGRIRSTFQLPLEIDQLTLDRLEQQAVKEVRTVKQRHAERLARWDELKALPQLFIAV